MSSVLRKWAAHVMKRSPPTSSPSYIKPQLLEKVEGIKKAGVPTKEASGLLQGMEESLKDYRRFWEDDQRKVQGLLRNRLIWRAQAVIVTIASAASVVKGSEVIDKYFELRKSGPGGNALDGGDPHGK